MNPENRYSRRNNLNSNAPFMATRPTGTTHPTALPPLPPRPPELSVNQMQRPGYAMAPSMFGSGYSGHGGYRGYPSYGGYGGYGGNMYGGYTGGYGFGSYGQTGSSFDNRFLQAAEESSRNTFQSIESLVHAFSSVSMMLESTYHAMYSSFTAVLGVVDNFSRLRQMFSQFISAITILSVIRNFYKKLLYWLGVINHNPQSEEVWNSVTMSNQAAGFSAWPIITFVSLLFGGPYLISKLFLKNQEKKKWDVKTGRFVTAAYPYQAASSAELSFSENETLNIAPKEMQLPGSSGWLLATNNQGEVGYIPYTRLKSGLKETVNSQTGTDNQSVLSSAE